MYASVSKSAHHDHLRGRALGELLVVHDPGPSCDNKVCEMDEMGVGCMPN